MCHYFTSLFVNITGGIVIVFVAFLGRYVIKFLGIYICESEFYINTSVLCIGLNISLRIFLFDKTLYRPLNSFLNKTKTLINLDFI